ncbi:hypothetical protein BDV95DRAFT_652988 [Massariosphaeria phaeospora]|uniref:PHD-type domain-containing protein n=1 Tax=Massariosphaeria phaeospora TaxID=100035 RepID=A0A7C8I009_9PLEO|nr:hypothetical protein BDV95DRAFT_652988 [Massariosphaeria phaeospora]
MASINSLLNHDSTPAQAPAQEQYMAPYPPTPTPMTTTYEAADALTTLATLGSGQQYAHTAPTRELPSPTAFQPRRRTSSFGVGATPVEPEPPIEAAHSPTLEHYHHGSNSPEEQKRRLSLLARTSPAPVLAPIHALASAATDLPTDEPQAAVPSPAHGRDESQMVPPPSRSSDAAESEHDGTQQREPAFVRDEPTTTQIREPEPAPEPEPEPPQLPSPLPFIKNEPSATPREATPSTAAAPAPERQRSPTADSMDAETLKAIEIAKQSDLGLRVKRRASIAESVPSPVDSKLPTLPNSKKRPAATNPSVKKKGTATTKKPAPKKRKLDPDADSSARSATPTRPSKAAPGRGGKKSSHSGTPVAGSSPAPDHSSQVHASEDEAESSDDNSLYCICRKPDNHKWMIGCDGGCEDWFHGSCVDMDQADEDLIDKFICPNCKENGRGETTWKPMCRRYGCRKPARLVKGDESKYCSRECGELFFAEQLQRTAGAKQLNGARKKSKKKGTKDSEDLGNASDDEAEPTPLGGVLRAKDLKALVEATNDIEAFKRLGSGVLSPPQTASPTKATFGNGLANGTSGSEPVEDLTFTAAEQERLNALFKEKSHLKEKLEVLKDREKFVSLVREQAARFAEREKIKYKEFCGYDSRLSWSDAEFLAWRRSKHGHAAFKFSSLSPTPDQLASLAEVEGADTAMANGDDGNDSNDEEKETVCLKKRCPKHPQWQKGNLQDARFEELEVVEWIKECEKEERSVRDRARRRGVKDAMATEITGGVKEERNRDGWVEMVAQ